MKKFKVNARIKIWQIVLPALLLFNVSCVPLPMDSQYQTTKNMIEKTSYIIGEAYNISSYFFNWDSGMLSRAMYFQEYAYRLFRSGQYQNSISYTLRARDFALDAIEMCDDYWEYYDYTNYGYSPVWGVNKNVSININIQNNHYGNTNRSKFRSAYKYNPYGHRLNYDRYFSDRELRYMKRCPADNIMYDNFYHDMGYVMFEDARVRQLPVYSRIYQDRNEYSRQHPTELRDIAIQDPIDIRPSIARRPISADTRRITTDGRRITTEPRRPISAEPINTDRRGTSRQTTTRREPSQTTQTPTTNTDRRGTSRQTTTRREPSSQTTQTQSSSSNRRGASATRRETTSTQTKTSADKKETKSQTSTRRR